MTEIKKATGINEADAEAGINEAFSEAGTRESLSKADSTKWFREEHCDSCPLAEECRKAIRLMSFDEIIKVTKMERPDKIYRVRLHPDDVMLISGINVKAKSEEEAKTKVEREIKLIVDHLIPVGNR